VLDLGLVELYIEILALQTISEMVEEAVWGLSNICASDRKQVVYGLFVFLLLFVPCLLLHLGSCTYFIVIFHISFYSLLILLIFFFLLPIVFIHPSLP
jgi:hypothetical protein